MYYDVGDRIKIEFLAPRVVQAKFREIAKTITKPRFSIFLAISRTPKKMSEPGVINSTKFGSCVSFMVKTKITRI